MPDGNDGRDPGSGDAQEGPRRESPSPELIGQAALLLDRRQQEDLFDLLLGDVEVEPDPEIEAAWIAEVDRRAREMEEGLVEGIPGEEVFAKVRKRLTESRPPSSRIRVGEREVAVSEVFGACFTMPFAERVALAGQLLASLRQRPRETDEAWLRVSERCLERARELLGTSGAPSRGSRIRPKTASGPDGS